jgi:hypothetical protein
MCSMVRYTNYVWLLRWNLNCFSPHSCRLHIKRLNTAAVRLYITLYTPTLPTVDYKNVYTMWIVHKQTMYGLSFHLMLSKHANPSKSNNLFLLALRMHIRPIPYLTSTHWPPYLEQLSPISRVANASWEKSLNSESPLKIAIFKLILPIGRHLWTVLRANFSCRVIHGLSFLDGDHNCKLSTI